MNQKIETVDTMEQLMPLITECLAAGQSVRIFPRGTSMLPMIRQGIDSVMLSPVTEKLKKYDLPLYRRNDGKYILHRIIAVDSTYTCMGDNQFVPEPGILQDQLIAVVTAFYRGEKQYHVTQPAYRFYCRLWQYSRPVRHFWRRGIRWLRRKMK